MLEVAREIYDCHRAAAQLAIDSIQRLQSSLELSTEAERHLARLGFRDGARQTRVFRLARQARVAKLSPDLLVPYLLIQ